MRTEDGHIVQECLNGQPGAFGMLVDKYKEGIYAFAYDKLRSFEDAEDVTQEVFLQAYRGLRTLRRWESLAFWLYRIAYARCNDVLRIRARRVDRELTEDQDPEVIDAPSLDSYRRNQLNESLWEALDALPGIYREVLTLHYFGGMTIKDIARATGASPSAIGKRLSRGRAQLKEEMIAMMNTAFEEQRLQAGFTFRIVESVKRIKINPMPRMTGLPWGLSLAAGIAIVVMTLGSQMAIHQSPELTVLPGETRTLKVREIAVDILSAPGTSIMAGKQGNLDGGGMDPRNPQNTFLLAPAKGGGTWAQKADMPTARYATAACVVDGRIYVSGGATEWRDQMELPPSVPTVEVYDPATDTWTQASDMPRDRYAHSASVVAGKMYIIGGGSDQVHKITDAEGFSIVDVYDLATDTWTTVADFPTASGYHAAAVVDGKIYTIGGLTDIPLSTVEEYDPGLSGNIAVTNPAGKLLRTWGEVKSE